MRVIHQTISADGTVSNDAAPWTAETLTAAIAEKRYVWETSGITVQGVPISTERGDHRIVMAQIRAESKSNSGFSVGLKTAVGFVQLNAAQILAITDAMLLFINACFAREAELVAMFTENADLEAIAAAAETGWPTREY